MGFSLKDIVSGASRQVSSFGTRLSSAGTDIINEKLDIFNIDDRVSRLGNAGLLSGASPNSVTKLSPSASASVDTRVKVLAPTGSTMADMIASSPVMRPLGRGVIFPYVPDIGVIHTANYTQTHPTHSNFNFPSYQNSAIEVINVNGEFTASNVDEARYMLAMRHFFETSTKMFYGQDDNAGTPPPVLRLRGHGRYMFDDIPVVVTSFAMTLLPDVDYIPVNVNDNQIGTASLTKSNNITMVPTTSSVTITLMPLYSRDRMTNEFSLRDFANGKLVSNGNKGGFL